MTTVIEANTPAAGVCIHHWVIQPPNGRTSPGVCKRCGEHRDFANANESVMWEQTNTLRNSPTSGLRSLPRPSEVRLSDEIVAN